MGPIGCAIAARSPLYVVMAAISGRTANAEAHEHGYYSQQSGQPMRACCGQVWLMETCARFVWPTRTIWNGW
jgi:hypothetical protein